MYGILNKNRALSHHHPYTPYNYYRKVKVPRIPRTFVSSRGESVAATTAAAVVVVVVVAVVVAVAVATHVSRAAKRLMTFCHAKLFNFSSLLGQFRCMTGYSKTVSTQEKSNR